MPTDTFYGLAADPFNLRAVERVYEIKSRSRHKATIVADRECGSGGGICRSVCQTISSFWRGVSGRAADHDCAGGFAQLPLK